MDEIRIPDVPQEIIDAINNDNLAVFVGAGVSAIAGLPLWSQLAKDLIFECYSKDLYSYKDKELILEQIHDNKQLITIAYGKLKEAGLESGFYRILKSHLKLRKSKIKNAGSRIFSWLRDTNSLVLTTNADELLHEYFEPSLIYEVVPDLKEDQSPLQRGRLVHLHGVISRKETLVFTTKQYLQRYRTPQYQEYLKTVFTTKTVLFIGYGMSEFELLDILIQKSSSNIHHFILAPYFTYAQPIASAMQEYYSELGIKQIDYYIDEKGYPYLAEILDSWLTNIKLKSNLSSRLLIRIREIVKLNPSNDRIKEEALQMIKTDTIVEKEFFANLKSQTEYDVDWLLALESSECFDPKFRNNPPKPSNEGDGRTYYSAVPWFGFRRLLELAQAIPEDILVRNMLARVVKATILDTLSNPEKAGNWAIGSNIAKSIVLLSPDEIGDTLWDYIQLVSKSPFTANQDIFTAEFSHNLEKILNWSSLQILRVLEMYFEYQTKPGSDNEYWLERITDKWLSSIVALIPDSVVKLCIRIIEQRYKDDDFSFWEVGAISKYPDENGIMLNDARDYNASLIIWLRAAIGVLSADSAIELVSSYIQSPCPVLRRMAIFTISLFYANCYQFLFEVRGYILFDDREILSDLFDLIKSNRSRMDRDQIEILYQWILNSNFGIEDDGNQLMQSFRRAIFLSLFKDLESEFLGEYIKYYNIVHREILESDAYNLSKHMYTVSSGFENPNPEMIATLESNNLEDWPDLLEEVARDATQYTIWEWNDAISKKLSIAPELILEKLEHLLRIPDAFLPNIIRQIESLNFDDPEVADKIMRFLFGVIKKKSGGAYSNTVIIETLSVIRSHYLDTEKTEFHEEIANQLNNWVSTYEFENEPWNQREDPVFLLYTKSYPVCLTTLISTLIIVKGSHPESEVIRICLLNFHDRLQKNRYDWVIRSVLGSQLEGLTYLDHPWAEEHIPAIFNNHNADLAIPVAICHAASRKFFSKWYPYFCETGFFISTLNTVSDKDTDFINRAKSDISGIATYAYLKGLDDFGKPNSLLDAVILRNNADMLSVSFSLFEKLLAQEAPTEPNREVLEAKFEYYLVEVMKYFSDFEHLQLLSLVKCVQQIESPSLAIWNILIDFASKCPEYYIHERWFDLMQKHFDIRAVEVADLLASLIKNPKFSHLQEDEKRILHVLLQKLHEVVKDEKVRTIRNLLIGKGCSEFAEIS